MLDYFNFYENNQIMNDNKSLFKYLFNFLCAFFVFLMFSTSEAKTENGLLATAKSKSSSEKKVKPKKNSPKKPIGITEEEVANQEKTPKKEILFEGYFKVLSGKQHIGYSISRYEFDSVSKNFYATIFVKVGALGGNFVESVKAISDNSLVPISYEYNTLVTKENNSNEIKKIEVKFQKGKMIGTLFEMNNQFKKGRTQKLDTKIPKGTFLSYFLVYLMLKSQAGIQTESKYTYKAIAEETGKIVDGEAKVLKLEDYNGFKAYKIENEFNGLKFFSYVTDKGDVLGLNNPAQSIQTELVAKPNDAVGSFAVPATNLKSLFGDVPVGTKNIVSQALQSEALKQTTEPAGSKQFGTPANSGIISKPANLNEGIENHNNTVKENDSVQPADKTKGSHGK